VSDAASILADERERIARDLHDTVMQRLFATGLSLQSLARRCERTEISEALTHAANDLDGIIGDIRSAVFRLDGGTTGGADLRRRVEALIDETSRTFDLCPTLRLEGPLDTSVPAHVSEHAVAVLRETIANAARHSGTTRLHVIVAADVDRLQLQVVDDGTGLTAFRKGGRGLRDLLGRATSVGGTFQLEQGEPRGCIATWTAPLRSAGQPDVPADRGPSSLPEDRPPYKS
jgi:two-component system sensor histidine kinase DevS